MMRMQSLILRLELKRDLNSSSSAPAELPVLGCTANGQKWQIRGAQHCHWRCLLSGEAKFTSTSEMKRIAVALHLNVFPPLRQYLGDMCLSFSKTCIK